jgi:ABC-type antimicrobial peptide transport system permease subunit
LNAFVFSALGGIALLIAIVGVAGVLAFSVSRRTREFGVRLAVGSTPRDLRASVLWDGVRTAAIGIAAGAAGGYALMRVAQGFFGSVQLPGALPVIGAAVVLIAAAIVASLMPAARASRISDLSKFPCSYLDILCLVILVFRRKVRGFRKAMGHGCGVIDPFTIA